MSGILHNTWQQVEQCTKGNTVTSGPGLRIKSQSWATSDGSGTLERKPRYRGWSQLRRLAWKQPGGFTG
eukprot:16437655-Heterocapsa_arctica.AAC.1